MSNFEKVDYKKKIRKTINKMAFRKKVFVLSISIILIICILLCFLIIGNYYKKLNEVHYDNYKLYQYFSGIRMNYKGNVTIKYDGTITKIKTKDKKIDMGYIPIYFQNIDNEVLFPSNMELIFLDNKKENYRVNYFSKINTDVTNNEEISFLIAGKDKFFLKKSFLYNGEDLYFFPYSVSVVIDKKVYNLSPLSYVIVNYKNMIEIYDKAKDEYIIIDSHSDDVIATLDNYKINLSVDMIMYDDNENKLLIKNIDKLKLYSDSVKK